MEKRNTIQKELVLDAVLCMHHHVTADEVYEFIRKDHPTIGKGTVYRNLAVLTEEGKIQKVEIPDGPDRFDYITDKHFHVRCVKCGRVFDVEMEKIPELWELVKDSNGVTILDYDILFKGICEECKKGEL